MLHAAKMLKNDRRGIALIVVLLMLGLFAALGLTFSRLAKLESLASRNYKRIGIAAPRDVNALMTDAVLQLIYDTDNEQSAIRGHSLLRDMYGGPKADGLGSGRKDVNPVSLGATATAGVNYGTAAGGGIYDPADPRTWFRGVYNGTGLFLPVDYPTATGYAETPKYTDTTPTYGVLNGTYPNYTVGAKDGQLLLGGGEIHHQFVRLRPNNLMGATAGEIPADTGFRQPGAGGNPLDGLLAPKLRLNFTVFDAIAAGAATPGRSATERVVGLSETGTGLTSEYPSPEKYVDQTSGQWHYFGYDEDYDYPDINDMYLALERADGTVVVPSFHRPHWVRQLELDGHFGGLPGNIDTVNFPYAPTSAAITPNTDVTAAGVLTADTDAPYPAWQRRPGANAAWNGRQFILRPRRLDVNSATVRGTGGDGWQNLRDVNRNGIVGDIPEELDVDTDGDGIKDAVWVSLGSKPIPDGAGGYVMPLYAFKVLDLDGKINLNTAGTMVETRPTTGSNDNDSHYGFNKLEGHHSHLGASPAEVNPKPIGLINVSEYVHDIYTGTPTAPRLLDWRMIPQTTPPTMTAASTGTQVLGEIAHLLTGYATVNRRGKWNPASGTYHPWDRPGVNTAPLTGSDPLHENYNETIYYDRVSLTGAGGYSAAVDWSGLGQLHEPFSSPGAFLMRSNQSTSLQAAALNVNYYRTLAMATVNHHQFGHNDIVRNLFDPPGAAGEVINMPALPSASSAFTNDPKTAATGLPAPMIKVTGPMVEYSSLGGVPTVLPGGSPLSDLLSCNLPDEMAHFAPLPTTGAVDYKKVELGEPTSTSDTPFLAEEVQRLLAAGDIDAATFGRRIEELLPTLLRSDLDTFDPSGTWTNDDKRLWTRREFARKRIRHLLTHQSWDLSRFSMPPSFPVTPPTTLPTASTGFETRIPSEDAGSYQNPADVAIRHRGQAGLANGASGQVDPLAKATNRSTSNSGQSQALVGSTGATAETTPRQLYPRELAEGQRYDLNTRFIAYEDDPIKADAQRSDVAQQIFSLLMLSVRPSAEGTPQECEPVVRTLAQLAVNIVDFMDTDTAMTRLTYPGSQSEIRKFYAGTWTPYVGTAITPDLSGTPTPSTFKPLYVVFGFELPDLVLNEAVAVASANTMDTAEPDDVNIWAELRNPWNKTFDQNGNPVETRAPKLCGAGGTTPYSIYKLHVVDDGLNGSEITFDTTTGYQMGYSNATAIPGDSGRNGTVNSGYILVGPPAPVTTAPANQLNGNKLLEGWTEANNYYTTTGPNSAHYQRPHMADPTTLKVKVELLRLRNPYAAPTPVNHENPYVRLDYFYLSYGAGAYYATMMSTPKDHKSIERQQPWVGQGADVYDPSLVAKDANEVEKLVGDYIGFPAIGTNPAGITGRDFTRPWNATGLQAAYGGYAALRNEPTNLYDTAGMSNTTGGDYGNTFAFHNVDTRGRNSHDKESYLSFFFANRPLASPMELLSVRLYGCYFQSKPDAFIADPYTGSTDGGQWRLRFHDDYEFAVDTQDKYRPGVYRSRATPWTQPFTGTSNLGPSTAYQYKAETVAANKVVSAFSTMRALPRLWRFFEFVECHDRVRDAIYLPSTAEMRRKLRQPGKQNLNTITEDENFRALLDTPEAMPAQNAAPLPTVPPSATPLPMEWAMANPARLPDNYAFNYFRNLWTTDLLRSGGETTTASSAGTTYLRGVGPTLTPTTIRVKADNNANNFPSLAVNASENALKTEYRSLGGGVPDVGWLLGNMSWPGIRDDALAGETTDGFDSSAMQSTRYPAGRNPHVQVQSELFRQFLLSRSGPDGIAGTADDQPFRSFASPLVTQTMLRRRDYKAAYSETELASVPFNLYKKYPADFRNRYMGEQIVYGTEGATSIDPASPTDHNTSAAGQFVPRLFDPVPQPFEPSFIESMIEMDLRVNPMTSKPVFGGSNGDDLHGPFFDRSKVPAASTGVIPATEKDKQYKDYWMLEYRRNRLLGKIANNTTTRSHVFGCYVAVGFFKVEAGTEGLKVPLLNEEIGSATGQQVRHRAFFIVDRSKAPYYNGPASSHPPDGTATGNPSLDDLMPLPGHFHIIE